MGAAGSIDRFPRTPRLYTSAKVQITDAIEELNDDFESILKEMHSEQFTVQRTMYILNKIIKHLKSINMYIPEHILKENYKTFLKALWSNLK